jgi:hypothetical protein
MVSNERKHTVGVFCGLLNGVICELSTLKKKKKMLWIVHKLVGSKWTVQVIYKIKKK